MVSMDDVLTRNLRVALSPPLFRLGPGNVLVLGVRPVVVDSCLALGKVPNGLGSFMMLGLKLEGMGEMGFLSFLPVNITPGDPTCTGDLTLDALDLAGYGD